MNTVRSILLLALCFPAYLLTTLSAMAADATFSWIPNNPAPSGYKIYYGFESRNYNQVIDVGLPSAVDGRIIKSVAGLEEGETYYFAATAYSETEESLYTDEVIYTVPAPTVSVPPVASNISFQGNEDNPLSGQLLAEDNAGADLTFSIMSEPANGSLTIDDTTGTFSYSPDKDFSGVDSFIYTASNDAGTSAPATVTITLNPVNDLPVAIDGSFTVDEDGNYSGKLSATDIDGDTLFHSLESQGSRGLTSINQDGSFLYIPYPDTSGPDSFTFKVSDDSSVSNIATITININPINDTPVAESASISVDEDSSYTGQLAANDIDGDTLTYSLLAPAARGSVIVNQSGSYVYTPQKDFSGSDTFTFTASDGSGLCGTAVVTITVLSVNDAPIADDLAVSLEENSYYTGHLSASDHDQDSLFFTLVSQAARGVVSVESNGLFSYTPETNYYGNDMFTFRVSDGSAASSIATVYLVITEGAHEFAYELGELQVSAEWSHIDFTTEFIKPAIVVNPTTSNAADAVLVAIRNLTSSGFDIRLNTWASEDITDQTDVVTYLAMEQGYHEVADNVHVLADCTTVSGINTFQTMIFSSAFPSVPIVVSSVVTDNDTDVVTLRLQEISQHGFSITMQEQENSDQIHAEESICYIAWEKWSGMMDDMLVEVDYTPNGLTDSESTHAFTQQFPNIPFVYAGMQSSNGMDTATLHISNIAVSTMNLRVQEEQSADSEMIHDAEVVGYFAMVPYNASEDSDLDGLTNSEEKSLLTHPGLIDSDQDGINDGDELQYLWDNNLSALTDTDDDGIINLLDIDSDNDGVPDGAEIAQGSDPFATYSIPDGGLLSYMLDTPTNISASIDGGAVTVSWQNNSVREEGYYIERAIKYRGKYIFERIAAINPGIDFYVEEGLETGSYKYRVQSFSGTELSSYSEELDVQVETMTLPPDSINLAAPSLSLSISGNDVHLSWQHDCSSASGCSYNLERGEKVQGTINFYVVDEIIGGTTYSDSDLAAGSYSYRVSASVDGTAFEYSNTVTARIK